MKCADESLVLVVDDKAAVRYVTERAIRNAGFRTAEAACGEEALEKVAALKPDVILLDIAMPDIDGYEVCRRIRENDATASVAVIMLSATFESAEHRVRGLEGGADTFLVAPVENAVLVATVRAMIRLRRAEAQLREFDRRKDEFLATLAHELRNPLSPLLYCIELLEPQLKGGELGGTLAIMRRQSEHLVRLVDDLVDMSRVTQNKLTLKVEPIALHDVIETAVEARSAEISAKNQTLTIDLPAQPVHLNGDLVRLAQVFGNLITNSIRYTEDGGRIDIVGRIEGSHVGVSVIDDGIGIPSQDLDRIFGLFVQGRNSGGGLGIGLALVHRIVQMHNGTITAASEGPHRGSTFTVRLPIMRSGTKGRSESLGSAEIGPAVPLQILIVDDNIDSADTMAKLLRSMGHDVRTCYAGEPAVEVARSYQPDLAFVDVTMPGMNGYETISALRSQVDGEHAMLCTLTGHSQLVDRERSERSGADLHLVKPIGRAALERVIRMAGARLNRRRT